MDFLPEQEINDLLDEFGITSTPLGDDCVVYEMGSEQAEVCDCLCTGGKGCDGNNWTNTSLDAESLVEVTAESVRRVHHDQTILIPCGKWRCVFDAVAFSMAGNELWQEFDASATVRLNTRDPLLFESGDEQILVTLLTALMNNGQTPDQSVFLVPAGAPILVHLQPEGPVKLWFGNSVLADEVREHYAS